MRERNSYFKFFYGMSFEIVMKKYVGGVVEYRVLEYKIMELWK